MDQRTEMSFADVLTRTGPGEWSIAWASWASALAALRIGDLAAGRRYMDRCLQLENGSPSR